MCVKPFQTRAHVRRRPPALSVCLSGGPFDSPELEAASVTFLEGFLLDVFVHSAMTCPGAFSSRDVTLLSFRDIPSPFLKRERGFELQPPTSPMHLLLINKAYEEWKPRPPSEMRSDVKYFLLVRLSSRAVCSRFLSMEAKPNCKQRPGCFSSPNLRELKVENESRKAAAAASGALLTRLRRQVPAAFDPPGSCSSPFLCVFKFES